VTKTQCTGPKLPRTSCNRRIAPYYSNQSSCVNARKLRCAWFSRLLQHPARKRIQSIINPRNPHGGTWSTTTTTMCDYVYNTYTKIYFAKSNVHNPKLIKYEKIYNRLVEARSTDGPTNNMNDNLSRLLTQLHRPQGTQQHSDSWRMHRLLCELSKFSTFHKHMLTKNATHNVAQHVKLHVKIAYFLDDPTPSKFFPSFTAAVILLCQTSPTLWEHWRHKATNSTQQLSDVWSLSDIPGWDANLRTSI